MVESVSLLFKIAEQVERFHADIGSVDSALQKAPEILQAIRMNTTVNGGIGVVSYLMFELAQSSYDFSASVYSADPTSTC